MQAALWMRSHRDGEPCPIPHFVDFLLGEYFHIDPMLPANWPAAFKRDALQYRAAKIYLENSLQKEAEIKARSNRKG